jgi:hypothetical protein
MTEIIIEKLKMKTKFKAENTKAQKEITMKRLAVRKNIGAFYWFTLMMAATLMVFGVSAPAIGQIEYCGTPTDVTLYAGQTIESGTVTIANDEDNLYVTFTAENGWLLSETHLHVATSLAEIPQTKKGNPQIGKFKYSSNHNDPIQSHTYTISLMDYEWEADGSTELAIAAHAVVVQLDSGGNVVENETGWGDGDGFPGKNWAMYIEYTLQTCDGEPPEEPFWRTQTQGGWGTKAKGQNPGTYRDANFDTSFPSGLVVGMQGTNYAKFDSSGAIQCFLPQGGTADAFDQAHLNPDPAGIPDSEGACPARNSDLATSSDTSAGVLAGQAVALTLNIVFDRPGNGGDSPIPLADLIMVGTPCDGMTAQAVLDEANAVLAGSGSMTPSEINECASTINENFVDGVTNEGNLMTP